MLKLWTGIEKEGVSKESEVKTLFVCSDTPISFILIESFLQKDSDIRSVYFGAGRKPFVGVASTDDWIQIINYCKENQLKIIIEVLPGALNRYIFDYNSDIVTFIVAYYRVVPVECKLYFKTDDFYTTTIFSPIKTVDLSTVCEDMYADDTLLFEEV